MDHPELACDLSIADCIEEAAENHLGVHMHVGASAVLLQQSKFINRVSLERDVLDFWFWRN